MERAEYVDRVAIRAKVCTGCTMLVDGVCCDADPCEKLIAGFLEEPPADVVPAHRKENANSAPLTMGELRKMYDGEEGPVWVKFGTSRRSWSAILDTYDGELVAVFSATTDFLHENDYGKTWLAYRQKPEEGTV